MALFTVITRSMEKKEGPESVQFHHLLVIGRL